jgi:N-succinyl-L-ornithine transcarbamylase
MDFYSFQSVKHPHLLIEEALALKYDNHRFITGQRKTIALVFLNPSLRTRMSTQEAAQRMGMNVICFNGSDAWSWEMEDGAIMDGNKTEHIKDAAKVISNYVDMIGIRCFANFESLEDDTSDKIIKQFIKHATVPVINMESAALHPLQSLTDMITMSEFRPGRKLKVALTWAPHPKALPHAVANSFAQWTIGMGHDLTICHPEGFDLDKSFSNGAKISHNQEEAFQDADIVYAKSWSSSINYGIPTPEHKDWMVDARKMHATNRAGFMHCLPVRRNVVVADEVIDGPYSLTIGQAKNRLYAAQIVIKNILEELEAVKI